jgi:hypothetical protein
LLVAWTWLGLLGVAVFATGLTLSLAPAARTANRLFDRIDRRRVP